MAKKRVVRRRDGAGAELPAELRDATRGERLQRVLADAGVASRRACEELIERGAVEVNGLVVDRLPVFVDPAEDEIRVDGRPIRKKAMERVYVMVNKPSRVLTTTEDEPGADRRTVVELVEHPSGARLYPVGRLDYDAAGLVLVTNDGELANRLTHARYGVSQTYRAKLKGVLDQRACDELATGMEEAERRASGGAGGGAVDRVGRVEIKLVRAEAGATWVELMLREGRNRQVRRMLAAVGYPVRSLERVRVGPLELKGVARGAWRDLEASELRELRRAVGQVSGKSDGTAAGKAGENGGVKASGESARATPRAGGGGGDGMKAGMKKKVAVRARAVGPSGLMLIPKEPEGAVKIDRRVVKNAVNRADPGAVPARRPTPVEQDREESRRLSQKGRRGVGAIGGGKSGGKGGKSGAKRGGSGGAKPRRPGLGGPGSGGPRMGGPGRGGAGGRESTAGRGTRGGRGPKRGA